MSIPHNKSIANPSPGHYDTRNDLGYGRTSNSGLGSTWSMGDALSAPKGEWDDEKDLLLVDFKKILNEIKSLFDLIDVEFDIEEELTIDEVEIERIILLGIVEDILILFDIDIYNLEDVEFDEVEVSHDDLINQLNIFLEIFEIKSSIDSYLDEENVLKINNKSILDKLEYTLQLLDIELDSFNRKDIVYNKKIHTSLNTQGTDSLSKKKTDPYSFNGLANTSQYLGASYKRLGKLIETYIKEVLLSESGISGKINVQKSGLGNMYKTDNSSVLGGTKGGIGGHKGPIDIKGYGQEGIKDKKEPYFVPSKATTDGNKTIKKKRIKKETEIFDDESSIEALRRQISQENQDRYNVDRFK